jgi:hypothetical protein
MMSVRKSFAIITLLATGTLALGLGGCSQSQSRELVDAASGSGYPARLALGDLPAGTSEAAPLQPEGASWSRSGAEVAFGVTGQPALLSIACTHDAAGPASLTITRHTRAEAGAKALLALIGNGRIARLPVDVAQPGEAGQWRGVLPAADVRLDVLRGGNRIEGTLPGGGTLLMPASSEPGRLLEECRASDRSPAQPAA